jgi:SAM-dependent methyltransferase
MGLKVTGVDLSPSSKQACEPHEVFVSNIEKNPLPFSDNSFDLIFSKSVIEHLRSPIELMEEAYRVLKPGGAAIIMTPSWVHNYSGSFYLDHTHVSPFTRPSLRDIALMTKFENVFVQHFYQLPFLWRFPALLPCVKLFGKLPLPYKPMNDVCLHPSVNTLIRFSREVMLLCVARKPLQ